jgi:deoxyribodipyrimidine photo-lyase
MESDYEMEWLDTNRAFRDLPRGQDERLFTAWSEGLTGYPMVDASMRCLQATGYVNFRMRAMLVTFWSFTLWQDWRTGARHLARLFLDFEPGIHYPQWQMQSGTTGYGTLRIYNPTVQCERHDPAGDFIRRWIPELKNVPPPLLFEPWKMTALDQKWYSCTIGMDYPAPVVEFESATRTAKDRYWAFRQSPAVQEALPGIWGRLCVGGTEAMEESGGD